MHRGSSVSLLTVLIFVFFSVSVLAATAPALCSDTDAGGAKGNDAAIKIKGSVTYGITPAEDVCLTSETGVSINTSKWLKEYYCASDKRESKIYDCVKLGYSNCVHGECTGGSATASGSSQNKTVSAPASHCGNKIMEKNLGEQCDPPARVCFGKTSLEYGICQSDCSCKLAAVAERSTPTTTAPVCGDNIKDTSEECEADTDCPTQHVCSSCNCVKQLTAEEIAAMKNQPASPNTPEVSTPATSQKTPPPASSTPEQTPSEPRESQISGFFSRIFSWLGSIFS